jgi:N utilization substance protein B
MLNRRHLRIKVLQALYAFFQNNEVEFTVTERNMMKSVNKIYDMYLLLLLTFSEIKTIAVDRIEENKKKLRPTDEDLNPNMKWIDNAIVAALENNKELAKLAETHNANWEGVENREMFRKLFMAAREGETFFSFMHNEQTGFDEDRSFALQFFKEEIANNELVQIFFEDQDIHWIDDLDLCCSMVVKTIKGITPEETPIMPLFKDEKDEINFVKELMRKTITMDKENEALIDELTKNWELDRIAKMDVILMKMALTEMQVFPNIPTKVTLNEYIEISKFYSTPKSNSFINGILDKAITRLTEEGKIEKSGRGLMK